MNPNQIAAYQSLERAQQALKHGDKLAARQFTEQAADFAPELEDVWLMLAALASPRASVRFLERALQINPDSERAQKGMVWAKERIRAEATRQSDPTQRKTLPNKKKGQPRLRVSYILLALVFLCLGTAIAFVVIRPATALVGGNIFVGSQVESTVVKPTIINTDNSAASPSSATPEPTFTPTPTLSPTVIFTATFTATATSTLTETLTLTPTETSTESASPTPLPTDTAEPIPPTQPIPVSSKSSGTGGVHWIDVDLSEQMVYAYEGKTIVNSFLVSTGVSPYRTITGSFHIYDKVISGNMWGPGYYLPDVPYIMYFQKGYALHGTYWHTNFGTPMSHGCVNLTIPAAEWLYYWAPIGTSVKVHN